MGHDPQPIHVLRGELKADLTLKICMFNSQVGFALLAVIGLDMILRGREPYTKILEMHSICLRRHLDVYAST